MRDTLIAIAAAFGGALARELIRQADHRQRRLGRRRTRSPEDDRWSDS